MIGEIGHGRENHIGSGFDECLCRNGPVLTAMVNICAAVPETTPKGAFSMTIASFALTPALESPIK